MDIFPLPPAPGNNDDDVKDDDDILPSAPAPVLPLRPVLRRGAALSLLRDGVGGARGQGGILSWKGKPPLLVTNV